MNGTLNGAFEAGMLKARCGGPWLVDILPMYDELCFGCGCGFDGSYIGFQVVLSYCNCYLWRLSDLELSYLLTVSVSIVSAIDSMVQSIEYLRTECF